MTWNVALADVVNLLLFFMGMGLVLAFLAWLADVLERR